MHYHIEVWIPDMADVQADLEEAMDPYSEHQDPPHPLAFHDWWQIGGRWKGEHVNYDRRQEEGWPTDWKQHPQDVMAVEDLPKELSAYLLILPDEDPITPQTSVAQELHDRYIRSGYLVTVDCHC